MKALVVSIIGLYFLSGWSLDAAELSGVVVDESGEPIAAARVDISTATPRVGRGIFCPSCYLDCRKQTTTDDQGRFRIADLSDTLKFRVLFTAAKKEAHITDLIDPSSGPVDIQLTDAPTGSDSQRIAGQVLDKYDLPIEGALLSPFGAKTAKRRWWGRVNVKPVVSNAEGRFELFLPESYLALDLRVQADGYAGTQTDLIKAGETDVQIKVPVGATIRGSLVADGEPAVGVRVAVVQTDRSSDTHFIKAVSSISDTNGNFLMEYLPPDQDYVVFIPVGEGGTSNDLVLTTKRFAAPNSGEERNLGELSMSAGLSLSGRVVATEGSDLSDNLQLSLGRNPAWDLIEISPDSTGAFEIHGLPPETYTIRVARNEVEIDSSRLSYQQFDKSSFGIHLHESHSEVIVPIRLSEKTEPDSLEAPKTEKLVGNQTLSGKVVDLEGQPLEGIMVSAWLANGYTSIPRRSDDIRPWSTTDEDGNFRLYGLPDAPIRLMAYKRNPNGGSIPYPAIARPTMNQSNISIKLDPSLTNEIESLALTSD